MIKIGRQLKKGEPRHMGSWCAATGRNPLAARAADLDAWIVEQRTTGARGKPVAESTIARRLSAVASWYDYLIVNTAADPQPLIRYNPTRAAARPRIDPDESPPVGLDRPEADRLLAEAEADSLTSYALILLLLIAGLRVGSVIAARVEDLGTDRGQRILNLRSSTPLAATCAGRRTSPTTPTR